ncbi:MAG: hypothetical protein HY959_07240 [Ignavibacteriae bacterium]|nr:hypothetical protein [Ignavibacteriota bacterium]
MKKLYLLLLLPFVIYYGCTGGCTTSCTLESCSDLISGKYNYTMTDTSGTKLVEGIIYIKDYDNEKISGTYTKDKVYTENFAGFSSMKGSFSGNVEIKEKKAFLNLNPKLADNNIFINIEIKKDSLNGKWTFSNMRGAVSTGHFNAAKVKK